MQRGITHRALITCRALFVEPVTSVASAASVTSAASVASAASAASVTLITAALTSGCAAWTPSASAGHTSVNATHIHSLAFSPDGRTLAAGAHTRGTVRLVDVATGALRGELRGEPSAEDPVHAIAWSPDGKLLVTGSGAPAVRVWDPHSRTLRATLPGHTFIVHAVAFRPDGRLLASGSRDGVVRLWEMPSGAPRGELRPRDAALEALAWSPAGDVLAVSYQGEGEVVLWDVARGAEKKAIGKLDWSYAGPIWRPADGAIAIGGDGVRLWLDGAPGPKKIPGAQRPLAMAFRPGAALELASIDNAYTIQLCSERACDVELPVDPAHMTTLGVLAWSPDGGTLAAAGQGPVARLVDIATKTVRPVFVDGITDRPTARPR